MSTKNSIDVSISLHGKYRIEIYLASVLGIITLAFGFFCIFMASFSLVLIFLGLLCFGCTSIVFKSVIESIFERRLYQQTAGKELVFSDERLLISIGIIQNRKVLKDLRNKKQSYFNLEYKNITEVIVLGTSESDSTMRDPCFKFFTKDSSEPLIVTRGSAYFGTNEDVQNKIINNLKEHDSIKIVFEDPK